MCLIKTPSFVTKKKRVCVGGGRTFLEGFEPYITNLENKKNITMNCTYILQTYSAPHLPLVSDMIHL